jgi:hypothetical protein
MATITPQNDRLAGIAGQSADTIQPDQVDFIGGHWPEVGAVVETVANGQDLAYLQVVGFDGSGNIVAANNTTVTAVGVMPYAVDATGGAVKAEIYRSGNFKPEALVWDAGYATDADKAKAFEGAPSPTQIVLTAQRTMVV